MAAHVGVAMHQEARMARWDGGPKLVEVRGESAALVSRLREPLVQALSGRRTHYAVRVETIGRIGEVLVSIVGWKGRLPLLFRRDELEPGHVSTVVRSVVDRFAL
jgi:hypothetical protein